MEKRTLGMETYNPSFVEGFRNGRASGLNDAHEAIWGIFTSLREATLLPEAEMPTAESNKWQYAGALKTLNLALVEVTEALETIRQLRGLTDRPLRPQDFHAEEPQGVRLN